MDLSGGCLCGSVRYAGAGDPIASIKCYCTDCRRTSGTGHAAHLVLRQDAVEVSGAVHTYSTRADSGHLITRAWCPTCGTIIYSLNDGMAGMIGLRASTLDDPGAFAPQLSVFASRAPAWDTVDGDLPSFPTMPPRPARPAGGAP